VSIGTRLRILEQRILPTEAEDDDHWALLLRTAPDAVLDYLEVQMRQAEPNLPVLADLSQALASAGGEAVPLRYVQKRVVFSACKRLATALNVGFGSWHEPAALRQALVRLLPGLGWDDFWEAFKDADNGVFVARWRECGALDAEAAQIMGLGVAELALLAADE